MAVAGDGWFWLRTTATSGLAEEELRLGILSCGGRVGRDGGIGRGGGWGLLACRLGDDLEPVNSVLLSKDDIVGAEGTGGMVGRGGLIGGRGLGEGVLFTFLSLDSRGEVRGILEGLGEGVLARTSSSFTFKSFSEEEELKWDASSSKTASSCLSQSCDSSSESAPSSPPDSSFPSSSFLSSLAL